MEKLFIFLFLGFLSSFAFAQNPSSLSWQQCLELLKNNNAEYRAAEWTYKATESKELGAESGYFPSLSGSLNYNQSKGSSSESLSGSDSIYQNYSASLSLSQNLFAGLKDYYQSSLARANTRGAVAVFQTAKAKISFDFITNYQSLLTALENLRFTESTLQRRQQDLRMVQLRFESGRENKGSVMLSQAYLDEARYDVMVAQHAVELAQLSLAQFLGLSNPETLKIADAVPTQKVIENPDFESLATQTPEHQQILATLDANLAGVGVARSGFFPTLSLTGTTGRNGTDFFPDQSDRWSVVASLTIPLFDGGRDYSALKSAQATQYSSLSHKITVDQEAVRNLKQTYQKYIESIERLKVDENFEKAALIRAEVARGQYSNGLISFTDWDQIENDLILRQRNHLQSKRDRVLNEATWNQTQGLGVLP